MSDELKPGWTEEHERKRAYAKERTRIEQETCGVSVEKLKEVPLERCVKEFKPEQFEKELKALKAEVQKISSKNRMGEPRKSNYGHVKALKDIDAIYCRVNRKDYTIKQLAQRFEVSERCVERCIKGLTYKHLNARYKPWF